MDGLFRTTRYQKVDLICALCDIFLMPEPDDFPVVHVSADERRTDRDYTFDNANREASYAHVIQRTLSGEAYFRDSSGIHRVPVGHAMLFTHDESTGYGFPPDATEPYKLRFLACSGAGLPDLFTRLRKDFGSVVSMPDNSVAAALFDETCLRFQERSFRDRLHQGELLYRLLLCLYREQVWDTRTSDPIEFGYHYVQNHFRSPVNLKEVAEKCGISREHFIREFSARYPERAGYRPRERLYQQ